MKIRILAPGRLGLSWAQEAVGEYLQRTRAWVPVEEVPVPAARKGSPEQRRRSEGEALLKRLPEVGYTVVLDERGRQLDSRAFSELIGARMLESRDLSFLVGGAEGLSRTVRDAADRVLSLSALTLPHDLARVVLAEQVYRALTILRNHPYHR